MRGISGYRLLRPLASGGMGEVWLAIHHATNTELAIKRLRGERLDQAPGDALLHEVRAVAALDHPGIVAIHDWGLAPEPWFAMERAQHSLADHLPDTWAGTRALLLQVLDALAHAHARDVLHLDLKPSNILWSPRGRWILADFGVARFRGAPADSESSRGTPGYMAPEHIRADVRDLGPPTDLYATACLGWTLATGRPPWSGPAALRGHLAEPLPPFRPRLPVAPGFEHWLRQGLDRDPWARPPSAAHAARSLAALDAPLTASTPPSSTVSPALPTLAATVALTAPVAQPTAAPDEPHPQNSTSRHADVPLPASWRTGLNPRRRIPGLGASLVSLRHSRVVGRDAVQDALWHALVRSRRGPALTVLTGDPGLGKRHLARWLAARCEEVGGIALHGAGPDATLDLARQLLSADGLHGAALDARVRRVAAAVGLTDPDTRSALAAALDSDSALSQPDRAFPVAALLGAVGRQRPLLVHLELDTESRPLPLIRALRSGDAPVLVLATAASDPDLPDATVLALAPLDRAHHGSLTHDLLALHGAAADQVAELAAGNPGDAMALVRDALARGWIVPTDRGHTLSDDADLPALARERAADALAGLPLTDRPALAAAAALGPTVHGDRWKAVCEAAEVPLAADLHDRMARAGWIEGAPDRWRFRSGSVRGALAQSAPPAVRSAAADVLLGAADPADAATAARLLLATDRAEEALEPLLTGIQHGIHRGWYATTEALLDTYETALDQARIPADDPRRGLGLERRLVWQSDIGKTADDTAISQALLEQARAHGWHRLLAAALSMRALDRYQAADIEGALADLDAAEEACAHADDPVQLTRTLWMRSGALIAAGRFDEAIQTASIARDRAVGDPRLQGVCWRRIGLARVRNGDPEGGRQAFEEARRVFEGAHLRSLSAAVLGDLGVCAQTLGDQAAAAEAYRHAIQRYGEGGYDPIHLQVNLAIATVLLGDRVEAATLLAGPLERLAASRVDRLRVFAVAAWLPTLEPGDAWDAAFDDLTDLLERTRIPDPDFERLLSAAATVCDEAGDPGRADRARTLARTLPGAGRGS